MQCYIVVKSSGIIIQKIIMKLVINLLSNILTLIKWLFNSYIISSSEGNKWWWWANPVKFKISYEKII